MKTILVTICFYILTVPIFAQISKGTSTVGGNVSLLREKTKYSLEPYLHTNNWEYNTRTLSITPTYGYFVTKNLCLGANLSTLFSHTTSQSDGSNVKNKSNSQSIGVGPLVRYYIPLDNKLYAYAATSYSWLWTEYKITYDNPPVSRKSESSSTQWNLGIGLSYFINPSTALEAGIDYNNWRYKNDGGTVTNKVNILALNIGFRVFLRKAE